MNKNYLFSVEELPAIIEREIRSGRDVEIRRAADGKCIIYSIDKKRMQRPELIQGEAD